MKDWTPREFRDAFLFLLPLLLFVVVFIVGPALGTFWTSLFQDVSFLPRHWIGLLNYRDLLYDRAFWQSLRFTALFVVASVPLEAILGLVFALVLNEAIPFRGFLRACVLVPWAIPVAVSARAWELIYNHQFGLANVLLSKAGLSSVHWLGTPTGAFLAILLADTWKTAPFVALILLAGLQAIPEDLYAEAMVDRAGLWQRFWRVTLPLLRASLIVALLFRTIDALRILDLIYVLSHGGPGGTTTSVSIYGLQYFLSGDFGYGSAVSILLFAVALGLAIVYGRQGRLGEER